MSGHPRPAGSARSTESIDLDGFEAVNDTLGHDAGDEVIRAVAERMRAATRPGDTVAPMRGDEFSVLLEDGGDAATVAARLLQALAQPAVVGRHTIPLAASIGIAHLQSSDAPVSGAVLLHRADTAMYCAENGGKGRTATWHDDRSDNPPGATRPGQPAAIPAAMASRGQPRPCSRPASSQKAHLASWSAVPVVAGPRKSPRMPRGDPARSGG